MILKTPLLVATLSVLRLSEPIAAKITADDFLVQGLEEIEPAFGESQGQMHAGLISIDKDINNDDGKLMFWLFEPDHPAVDDSLVIWFNGGPGCSSFDAGLLFEMGPVTTPSMPAGSFGQPANPPRSLNPYSWTNATAIMYVEQPVGIGFSYGDSTVQDEGDLSRDFYNFLQNFFSVFENHRSKRLYLVGESYAGYYVPSMAHYIHSQNKDKHNKRVNLEGIALGNGWADVKIQGPKVIDYAYWHGMIDSVTREAFHAEWEHCKLETGSEPKPFHPLTTPDECGIMENVLKAAGAGLLEGMAPNTYDVTTWDPYLVLNDPLNPAEAFFNNPRVQEALNVPEESRKKWYGCIPGAGRRRLSKKKDEDNHDKALLPGQILLAHDKPESMSSYIADLLDDAGIDVLVYNGDRDLSTCAQGSEQLLDEMEWSGNDEWLTPHDYRRALWMVNDYVAGYAKSVRNLQFVIVYNSGHMVPYNQPVAALDLVTRLVSNKAFGDLDIPVVFEAPGLSKSESLPPSKRHHHFRFLNVIFGFLLGVIATFVYVRCSSRRSKYEPVGNVQMSV